MKVDIGFWDINGNYIEDIQEIGELEMDYNEYFNELNEMANNVLRYEPKEESQKTTKEILDEFVTRLDNLWDYVEDMETRYEDERGMVWGEERCLWGEGLDELRRIQEDLENFVDGLEDEND